MGLYTTNGNPNIGIKQLFTGGGIERTLTNDSNYNNSIMNVNKNWWPIEWHIDHIFWIRGCKKFHYWRLRSYSEILLKFDKIMWKFHISLLFHWFECTSFKNPNLFDYVSKFYDTNFVEEYLWWPIEWHIDHIFWIRGCKKFHF